ncbi:MAG TPA: ribose 5-phosphate isomerase B [Bacteroidia bacterium]|jgi:ribose 5-phosphate isomerase B|nr:ribose 5-phosphate isomerase B [Bacteroidia bacterium]
MKLYIGSDHAGFELKEKLRKYLAEKKHEVIDHGCYSEERADYPDYAHKVANSVLADTNSLGILMCGSGNGINITANKHAGIRAALCWTPEIAALARQHNDANIITLPARFIDDNTATGCIDAFLSSIFEGGRHADRVKKIDIC